MIVIYEERVAEDLSSGATQSSSIGQHKSSSIDLIPIEDEDSEEPKTLNDLF